MKRNREREWDPDYWDRALAEAYAENGKERPAMRWWCPICHLDHLTEERLTGHVLGVHRDHPLWQQFHELLNAG